MKTFINSDYWDKKSDFYISKTICGSKSAFSADKQNELYSIEDISWWFEYRATIILSFLEKYFDKNKYIVDVGGGNGFTTKYVIANGYEASLIEPSIEACINAKKRGVDNIYCGTLCEKSVDDNCIESMMLLDVLEHIEDDNEFLKLLYKKMSIKGRCLITVPAFKSLWSSEDDAAGHFRRYRKKQLSDIVSKCGFKIVYSTYFMMFLYIPILLCRVCFEKIGIVKKSANRTIEEKERLLNSQFVEKKGIVKLVFTIVEKIEQRILVRGCVPFGSSILMIIEK